MAKYTAEAPTSGRTPCCGQPGSKKSRTWAPRKSDGPLEIRSQGDEIPALRTDLAASLPTVGLGDLGQPRPLHNRLQRVAERLRRRVHFLP